jgi:hypothetical protein
MGEKLQVIAHLEKIFFKLTLKEKTTKHNCCFKRYSHWVASTDKENV